MRVHVCAVRMTLHRADVLEAYLNGQDNIQKATVYERTGDVVLTYRGSRKDAAALLAAYRFDNEELEVLVTSHDSRKTAPANSPSNTATASASGSSQSGFAAPNWNSPGVVCKTAQRRPSSA